MGKLCGEARKEKKSQYSSFKVSILPFKDNIFSEIEALETREDPCLRGLSISCDKFRPLSVIGQSIHLVITPVLAF
jgi:hypothetical protein